MDPPEKAGFDDQPQQGAEEVGGADTPGELRSALRSAFGAFVDAVGPYCGQPELGAELTWGALHGMAVLAQSGRIPAAGQAPRLELLVDRIAGSR